MKRIRKGNSFNILYSAVTNEGEKIDLRAVEELSVKLAYRNGTIDVDYSFVEESIQVNISDNLTIGEHRLLISFKYAGFDFERDPKVFNIVSHSEDERNSSCDCDNVEVISIPVVDTLDASKLHLIYLSEDEIASLKDPAIQAAAAVTQHMSNIAGEYAAIKQNTEQMIQQTDAARQEAITARNAADTATGEANTARDNANTAAGNADGKAELAREKAQLAEDAAERAEAAAAAITRNWIKEW